MVHPLALPTKNRKRLVLDIIEIRHLLETHMLALLMPTQTQTARYKMAAIMLVI